MLANDVSGLKSLLADALVYTHSTGGKGTKETYLQKLASGALRYEQIEFADLTCHLIGNAGFVSAAMTATVIGGGSRREISNSYLAVWEYAGAGWQLLFLQGTPTKPAAPH